MQEMFNMPDDALLSYETLRNKGIEPEKLIKGQYEKNRLPKDFSPERIVPDFAFNVLNPPGLLYRPVLDEAYISAGGQKPSWPDGKPFAVCLTHDVDDVTLYSARQFYRGRSQMIRSGHGISRVKNIMGLALDLTTCIRRTGKHDPYHCYERWLTAETNVGATSTMFFWPGWSSVTKHHFSDCVYETNDKVVFDGQQCSVSEMIREMDRRGWEIGLHPSWYSYNDLNELKRQKAALEKALDKQVISIRQHQLHFDIRVTPYIHAKAGFLYDSTIGFNDNLGFRFGTSYPRQLQDVDRGDSLSVVEIPLVIQDGAMLGKTKGMRLDEDTAFAYITQITANVERVGGVLTLLWHPNVITDTVSWNLYIRTLAYLEAKKAWFGNIRQVGEKWKDLFSA